MRKKKKFKFDKRWLDNEKLTQVILEGWKSEDLLPEANIMKHIASYRKALSQWKRQNNVNSEKLVEELKEKVKGIYSNDDSSSEKKSDALKELSTALKTEEMFWRQKSRILRLREGDKNSKISMRW